MGKDKFYFQHDYHARNDEKILELRLKYKIEGYGLFWMVVESMAENENGGVKATLLGGLSLGYGVAKDFLIEFIKDCIEIGLFYEESGFYFSKRMLSHKNTRTILSEKGKEGAAKRWGGYKGGYSTPNAKERKGKEIAIAFEENFAIFSDGTKQELGEVEKFRLTQGDLKPQQVLKGQSN